jgi:putative restriction endonuclease
VFLPNGGRQHSACQPVVPGPIARAGDALPVPGRVVRGLAASRPHPVSGAHPRRRTRTATSEREAIRLVATVPLVAALADYLDLQPDQAVDQWRRILGRSPRPRQEVFAPVETLLAFGCFYLVDHRHYGGSTAHLAPEPVQSLARLFVRPPASILAKMANLDGSRSNRAANELSVFAALSAEPVRYAALYATILSAARQVGIEAGLLPDFLGLNDTLQLVLLGQDELTSTELEADVEPRLRQLAPIVPVDEVTTERVLEGVARIGQHRFAAGVLGNCGWACVFCGLRPTGLESHRLLTASHIKPWRDSDDRERLDVTNGLAACPTHDAAFDTGLLAVNGGLRIHESPKLVSARAGDSSMALSFGHPPLLDQILLPDSAQAPGGTYLTWHRERVFVA